MTTFKSNKRAFLRTTRKRVIGNLYRIGAYGRTTLANMFPRRGKVSLPNTPPTARAAANSGLKDVTFEVDEQRLTVAVGHRLYRRRDGRNVPDLLNFGGVAISDSGNRLVYRPRPFRDAALQIAADRMEQILKDED